MYRKLIVTIITIIVIFTMTFSTGLVYADDAAETAEPEGIPIYTAEELLALENEDGVYYLANDIDLKEYPNCYIEYFSGTLDGNGHTIFNYTVNENIIQFNAIEVGLFFRLLSASIKNLNMEDVNINCSLKDDIEFARFSALGSGNGSSFENITVSGNMYVKTNCNGEYYVLGGLLSSQYSPEKLENCVSDIDITLEIVSGKIYGVQAYGICTWGQPSSTKVKKCVNKGDLKITVHEDAKVEEIQCSGFDLREPNLVSCGNTGKLTVQNYGKIKSTLYMSGIAHNMLTMSKVYNKGNISADGRFRDIHIGGLACMYVSKVSQSYNKGKISLNLTSMPDENNVIISGVAGCVGKSITNSYNAGKIVSTGKWNGGLVSGLIGYCENNKSKVTSCYNSGKITVPSGAKSGAIMYEKNGILKDNYFRYGTTFAYNKAKSSQAKKVDAISKKNCSGLSSEYWTYSKSKKRMILKKNKES